MLATLIYSTEVTRADLDQATQWAHPGKAIIY